MTNFNQLEIWAIIVLLGLGTFGLRFSFLGIFGNRDLPEWLLRHLRYTAVAVMPGLVAPLVVWPAATGGQVDPVRLSAAAATIVIGVLTRNVLLSILAGGAVLFAGLFLTS